jgi:hypothetical protein
VKKVTIYSAIVVAIGLTVYALAQWRTVIDTDDSKTQRPANLESLPPLDASGVVRVREITKSGLLSLMSNRRPLSQSEKAQVDRGCPGPPSYVARRAGDQAHLELCAHDRSTIHPSTSQQCQSGSDCFDIKITQGVKE